jgi:NADH dehydrogenase FAD-containing subunit
LTFAIIGAGPTGVELAGTIAELALDTLPPDFRRIDTRKARVVLIEAGLRVLPTLNKTCGASVAIRCLSGYQSEGFFESQVTILRKASGNPAMQSK